MKNKFYFIIIIIILASFSQSNLSYANIGESSYIDINLTRPIINKESINFESMGGFSIYYKDDKTNSIHEIEESNIKAVLTKSKEIELLDSKGNSLFIIPSGSQYLLYGDRSMDKTIKIEKDKYRGYLYLDNIKGSIRLVNHVDIEDYLYGVVPREMPSSFPEEALKAQAVAARTYAIHNKGKYSKEGYDLCDTTQCQVYSGYDGENPLTTKAVDDTRHILATYNGNTIDAQYHSSSSGYTNDSVEVWGGDFPYLKSVKDEYSEGAPSSVWNISVDIDNLNSKLVANGINIGKFQGIEISKVSPNGNVNSLILKGSLDNKEIKASTFRRIIGNMDLKSTNFVIKTEGVLETEEALGSLGDNNIKSKYVYVIDGSKNIASLNMNRSTLIDENGKKKISASANRAINMNRVENLDMEIEESISIPTSYNSKIVIEGKGFGHGVGMSQYGAKKMAELGYSFQDILKHYYTGVDIY